MNKNSIKSESDIIINLTFEGFDFPIITIGRSTQRLFKDLYAFPIKMIIIPLEDWRENLEKSNVIHSLCNKSFNFQCFRFQYTTNNQIFSTCSCCKNLY